MAVTVCSFFVKGVKNDCKNLDRLQVGVPTADKVGRRGGSPFLFSLRIFPKPHKIPGLDPTSLMFL